MWPGITSAGPTRGQRLVVRVPTNSDVSIDAGWVRNGSETLTLWDEVLDVHASTGVVC